MLVDGHCTGEVPILRGSPQGSVLGCLLYCISTQRLTDGLELVEPPLVAGVNGSTPMAPSPPQVDHCPAPPRPAAVPELGERPVYFPQDDSDDDDANFWDPPDVGGDVAGITASSSPSSNTLTPRRSLRPPKSVRPSGMSWGTARLKPLRP